MRYKKIVNILNACLVATTFTSTSAMAADEQVPMAPFDLNDVITNVMGSEAGPVVNSSPASLEFGKKILSELKATRKNKDTLTSHALDDVLPVREPLYISLDPSVTPAEIFVTRTRSTTIAFLDENGAPQKITQIVGSTPSSTFSTESAAAEGDGGANAATAVACVRFCAETMANADHIVRFVTQAEVGWTTFDILFEGVPYPITVTVKAGRKYHNSAQAIVVNNTDMLNDEQAPQDSLSLRKVLTTLANYGTIPNSDRRNTNFLNEKGSDLVNERSSRGVELEYMSPDIFRRPLVKLYKTTIEGKVYYLMRTSGTLRSPEYTESAPSISIARRMWAYAIPESELNNIISINYGGGNHIYAVSRSNVLASANK